MKATLLVAAALLAAGSTAYVQEAPAPQEVRPQTVASLRVNFRLPVVSPPVEESAQDPSTTPVGQAQPAPRAASPAVDRRDDIKTLEAVLTLAVKSGADKLALQMRASEPGSLFVIDTGRTRGFDLEGYGVFFDVDVPMMKQSYLYVTRQLNQQDTRASLQNYIATLPDGAARDLAIRELGRMQGSLTTQIANSGGAPPGTVRATDVDTPNPVADAKVAPAPVPRNPNELYTEAVKTSLIDAMLKYSVGLRMGPDEWLTVAARDAQGPLTPGQPDDASTIVIRIKGGDLTAFHAGKLTREEVLKKVEVKEI